MEEPDEMMTGHTGKMNPSLEKGNIIFGSKKGLSQDPPQINYVMPAQTSQYILEF